MLLRRALRLFADQLLLAELGEEVRRHRAVRDSWQAGTAREIGLRAENERLKGEVQRLREELAQRDRAEEQGR